ncbi:MAG: hypothetical protein WCR56_04620 [Bacilli bacterium]
MKELSMVSLADYVQPTRNFSLAYVILDSLFVIFFVTLLFIKKKRVTAIWSLAGGLLYWLVDYGIFYLATGSREIFSYLYNNSEVTSLLGNLDTCLILFWMSMSYGILDFAFIWLWLSKDKNALEYSSLIVIWWICCPLMADFINNLCPTILCFMTTRSTNKYHGIMGLLMVVGYLIVILMNIFNKDKDKKIPIVRLFIIGFMAQFLWEFLLLVFGIRSQNYDSNLGRELMTLLQDSLVETNLGMPYIYFIHKAITSRYQDDGVKRALTSNN